MTNCKNCGAPIEGTKCPYCGTYYYDLTVLDMQHPGIVKINTPHGVLEGWMYIQNANVSFEPIYSEPYRDINGILYRPLKELTQTKIDLTLVSSEIKFTKK